MLYLSPGLPIRMGLISFLLKRGYIVHGLKHRASQFNTDRIDHLYQDPLMENRFLIG